LDFFVFVASVFWKISGRNTVSEEKFRPMIIGKEKAGTSVRRINSTADVL
jgi:hypothetical protein